MQIVLIVQLHYYHMQHQESQIADSNKYVSFEYKSEMDNGRIASSSDHESQ